MRRSSSVGGESTYQGTGIFDDRRQRLPVSPLPHVPVLFLLCTALIKQPEPIVVVPWTCAISGSGPGTNCGDNRNIGTGGANSTTAVSTTSIGTAEANVTNPGATNTGAGLGTMSATDGATSTQAGPRRQPALGRLRPTPQPLLSQLKSLRKPHRRELDSLQDEGQPCSRERRLTQHFNRCELPAASGPSPHLGTLAPFVAPVTWAHRPFSSGQTSRYTLGPRLLRLKLRLLTIAKAHW